MNLFTKQKRTHRHKKQTYSYQWGKCRGEGYIRRWELTHTQSYTQNSQPTRTYCVSQGTMLDTLYWAIKYLKRIYIHVIYIYIHTHTHTHTHICIHVTGSLCCIPENNTLLETKHTSIKKRKDEGRYAFSYTIGGMISCAATWEYDGHFQFHIYVPFIPVVAFLGISAGVTATYRDKRNPASWSL